MCDLGEEIFIYWPYLTPLQNLLTFGLLRTRNLLPRLEYSRNILVRYFGAPARLVTDRWSCFTSAKFKEFIGKVNIRHVLNAVATPRANSQVERFNRTVLDALSTRTHGKNENTWDEYVGDIQLGINTTVNKTTGKSPSELLFGCKLVTASENILSEVIDEISERVDENDLISLRLTSNLLILFYLLIYLLILFLASEG